MLVSDSDLKGDVICRCRCQVMDRYGECTYQVGILGEMKPGKFIDSSDGKRVSILGLS